MHKNYRHRIWIIVVALVVLVFLVLMTNIGRQTDKAYLQLGSIRIETEVADTQELQTKGLSGRNFLGDRQGMLFVFDVPGTYRFWMKDMKFPIDIVWINAEGQIVFVENSISPDTYPQSFGPYAPAKYVLEVNAGVVAESGVRTGDQLQIDEKFIKKL